VGAGASGDQAGEGPFGGLRFAGRVPRPSRTFPPLTQVPVDGCAFGPVRANLVVMPKLRSARGADLVRRHVTCPRWFVHTWPTAHWADIASAGEPRRRRGLYAPTEVPYPPCLRPT
jgi:hypothetical protein